jgi:3-deoxy-7-phosphoheptulonate synthase
MIIVIKPEVTLDQIGAIRDRIKGLGLDLQVIQAGVRSVIYVLGETGQLDLSNFQALEGVERVIPIARPFKLVSRDFKPLDTIVKVGDIQIGKGTFCIMAGPCAVESYEQALKTARFVKGLGIHIFRAGVFKPRTSPYSFQGLGEEGLHILKIVKEEAGLLIVTEVVSERDIDLVSGVADILQIGARNMQNYPLLKEVSRTQKPILLKRGLMANIEELLLSAEYIMKKGNDKVIMCERGIRTFEKYTRNTLDLSAVPVIHRLSHLPVIVDPSHACGVKQYVAPLAKAAVACGADGLLIEVHPEPSTALCDGQESLNLDEFAQLVQDIKRLLDVIGYRME